MYDFKDNSPSFLKMVLQKLHLLLKMPFLNLLAACQLVDSLPRSALLQ
jgi:hypothetical protein